MASMAGRGGANGAGSARAARGPTYLFLFLAGCRLLQNVQYMPYHPRRPEPHRGIEHVQRRFR